MDKEIRIKVVTGTPYQMELVAEALRIVLKAMQGARPKDLIAYTFLD